MFKLPISYEKKSPFLKVIGDIHVLIAVFNMM